MDQTKKIPGIDGEIAANGRLMRFFLYSTAFLLAALATIVFSMDWLPPPQSFAWIDWALAAPKRVLLAVVLMATLSFGMFLFLFLKLLFLCQLGQAGNPTIYNTTRVLQEINKIWFLRALGIEVPTFEI